jgi:hypothetical protein
MFIYFRYKDEQNYLYSDISLGSEMKPLTHYLGFENVLLGQGYRTPHGAVTDEYGAMVEQ